MPTLDRFGWVPGARRHAAKHVDQNLETRERDDVQRAH
jgi:hypothetical protein